MGNIFKKNYFIEAIVTLTFDSDPKINVLFPTWYNLIQLHVD